MRLIVGAEKINELGYQKIVSETGQAEYKRGYAWLVAIVLDNGQKVAAYSGSSLNPLSTPFISMTDDECHRQYYNKLPPSKIARGLKRYCKEDDLLPAIKVLKKAINSISKG